MSTDRFHKAAKDGLLEVLKEATKRDCNSRDEQGMTPTLYAAFYGNLEALRLLCGRGGDPDKADLFGNTALHLAAAQGHRPVVTFLVNFGANVYSRDVDGRTAQELAGMNGRDEVLQFLDQVQATLEAGPDRRKVKGMKERARKDQEKRIKEFTKRQAKLDAQQRQLERKLSKPTEKSSMIETLKWRIKSSGSMSNLATPTSQPVAPRPSFSALVGNGTIRNIGSVVQRKALQARQNKGPLLGGNAEFKVSEMEDGKRSLRSLTGLRRDSEVLYGDSIPDQVVGRRGRLDGVFEAESIGNKQAPQKAALTRSVSQPDFLQDSELSGGTMGQDTGSIFVRPGIGSIAFRKSIVNSFPGFYSNENSGTNNEEGSGSIGSGDSSYLTRNNNNTILSMEDELSESESSEEDNPNGALERFLTAWGLGEYFSKFEEQKVDLETLMILTESDLKSLNLPLGPHRKLVNAISERKAALENPGEVTDSLM